MVRVCFVCLGNICRSPLAEGAFRRLVTQAGRAADFHIQSAGTGPWHVGQPPDPRSRAVALKHGVDISRQRGQQLLAADLDRFDLIRTMDQSNLDDVLRLGVGDADVARLLTRDVPDPYYGGPDGFEQVWAMIEAGCVDLLGRLPR